MLNVQHGEDPGGLWDGLRRGHPEIGSIYHAQIVLKMQEDKVFCRDETVQVGKLANKTQSVSAFIECETREGEAFLVGSELSPCKSVWTREVQLNVL